ncbi:putative RNA methyltransferase [Streptomyces sp. NPDC007264]|uniref:putative RNA methyltransferase n=1 Tax=Streptomyces sp. NPDC007264 TaxID=3364777 RepID=UPI0036DA245B
MTSIAPARPPVFRCPVCEEPLPRDGRSFQCANGHGFDVAKEGYVNLLLAQHRHSKDPGYNKEMIAGRRDFFDAGHYEQLADGVADVIASYLPEGHETVVVDAGCGEGYYLRRLRHLLAERGQDDDTVLCGMDISKHGVRVAAKRDPQGLYAVAGTYRMPVITNRADVLLTHFSPVSATDFRRVVKPGGVVLVGGPGEDHLFSFKELLYDTPAQHEPADTLAGEDGFEPITVHRIRYPLRLRGPGQVANLLLMTPFYWSVGDETRAKLAAMDELDTEVDVVVHAYRRVASAPTAVPSEDASAAEGDEQQ